jgi:hypothetical protein
MKAARARTVVWAGGKAGGGSNDSPCWAYWSSYAYHRLTPGAVSTSSIHCRAACGGGVPSVATHTQSFNSMLQSLIATVHEGRLLILTPLSERFLIPRVFQNTHGHDLLHRGMAPARLNLSSGRRLPRAMMPKYLTYKIRFGAMMLKNFRISSPNGGLDPHVAQGYWEGSVETCVCQEVSHGNAIFGHLIVTCCTKTGESWTMWRKHSGHKSSQAVAVYGESRTHGNNGGMGKQVRLCVLSLPTSTYSIVRGIYG